MRLLLRDGLAITFVGLAAGLVLAALVTPLLGALLAGVPPRDPASFALVALVLSITALIASYGPARRGMRLSPVDGPSSGLTSPSSSPAPAPTRWPPAGAVARRGRRAQFAPSSIDSSVDITQSLRLGSTNSELHKSYI
jgi:hypothetical protein